jgi:hypothetical protein
MESTDINTSLVDGYLKLLQYLSPSNKLDLISKLTLTLKVDITKRKRNFFKAFGAWHSPQSADHIANEIRKNRTFSRKVEKL